METTNYTQATSHTTDASTELLARADAAQADAQNQHDEIRRRAHEIYEARCAAEREGDELSDWLEAERIVLYSRDADAGAADRLQS